jgi:Tol biopolymer transport system component
VCSNLAAVALVLSLLVGGCTGGEPGTGASVPAEPAASGVTPAPTSPGGLISFATSSRGQVALVRPDGSGRVERVAQDGWPAALSPDGRMLMVAGIAADRREVVSFVDTAGGERRDLSMPDGWNLVPGVWSPDGARGATARWGDSVGGGVYVAGVDGSGGRMISEAPGSQYDYPIAWSPDGRWIAFMRVRNPDSASFIGRLYLVAADGGGAPRLVSRPGTAVRHFYIGPASFFPDSKRLAFVEARGATGPEDPDQRTGRVVVVDLTTWSVTPLTAWSNWTLTTRVSPDGQWLVFDRWSAEINGSHRLFVVRADGTGLRLVPTSKSGSVSAVWAPEGTHLLSAVDGFDANNLVIVPLTGDEPAVELTSTDGETYLFYDWVQQR